MEIKYTLEVRTSEHTTLLIAFRTVSALSYLTDRRTYLALWDPMHRKRQPETKYRSAYYERVTWIQNKLQANTTVDWDLHLQNT